METVTININNTNYKISCEATEVDRLQILALHLNQRLKDYHDKFANAPDRLFFIMSMLMMEDRILELEQQEFAKDPTNPDDITKSLKLINNSLEALAKKLETQYS